ncbi:MAG: ribosomal RNA small subunit methyltransferase A [Chloroflexi bacterium]|nr:MAG: ribosomal RNA small subunit methyltransferase A [Chloroflexota bacterium]
MSASMPQADLTDPRTLRSVSQHAGLRRSRRMSQNFLVDGEALEFIVSALEVSSDDEVFEIGCGVGTLTGALASRAARVLAVDVDPACVRATMHTQRSRDNVTVIRADARSVDPMDHGFTAPWLATGNLPYHLTGPLLSHLLELPIPPARAVVLMQREVAARLAAEAGDWSLATVAIRSLASVERLRELPPESFDPAPAVHSSVVRLRPAPVLAPDARRAVLAIARAAFQVRRKTLRHGAARALGGDLTASVQALSAAGIDPARRPGTLHLDEWQRLASAVAEVSGPDP